MSDSVSASAPCNLDALLQSSYTLQTLFALAKVGVFDLLYSKAMPLDEASAELGVNHSLLQSLIKYTASMHYFEKIGNGYRVAAKGRPFSKHSGSVMCVKLLCWGVNQTGWGNLTEQLLTGRQHAFAGEKTVWDRLRKFPDDNAVFVDWMRGITTQAHIDEIVKSIPIRGAVKVIDIAGGTGALGCALAQNFPGTILV